MPPVALPFSFSGSLQYAPSAGAAPISTSLQFSGQYTTRVEEKYEISVAGTTTINFGTLPIEGAKVVIVVYDEGYDPVMWQLLPGGVQEELSAGSGRIYVNPNPTAGISSAQIIATAPASLRVIILG